MSPQKISMKHKGRPHRQEENKTTTRHTKNKKMAIISLPHQ